MNRIFIFAAVLLFQFSALLSAQTDISGAVLENTKSSKKDAEFSSSENIVVSERGKIISKDRISVRLNSGGDKEEAISLRYSLTFELSGKEAPDVLVEEIPCVVDTLKIPIIKGEKMVYIDLRSKIGNYLENFADTGYTPRKLKFSIMLSPKKRMRDRIEVKDYIFNVVTVKEPKSKLAQFTKKGYKKQ